MAHAQMDALGECLTAAFAELRTLHLPAALGHLDPNPQNIIVSPSSCCFLDWAEGCITHPFLTFEYLREHARRHFPRSDAPTEGLLAAYLRPWKTCFSDEILQRAISLSPLLAVFVYAVAGEKWRSVEAFENPVLAGYLRALARRAWREAQQFAARSDRCPV